MTDAEFKEFKEQLMADADFTEFVRNAFMKTLEKAVSIRVAVETDQKRCSVCHSGMFLRASKKDGGFFWGCANYPRCKGLAQATTAEVEEFARNYPDQFAVLKEQAEVYKAEYLSAGAKGYDNDVNDKSIKTKRAKNATKAKTGATAKSKDDIVGELLEDSKVE